MYWLILFNVFTPKFLSYNISFQNDFNLIYSANVVILTSKIKKSNPLLKDFKNISNNIAKYIINR